MWTNETWIKPDLPDLMAAELERIHPGPVGCDRPLYPGNGTGCTCFCSHCDQEVRNCGCRCTRCGGLLHLVCPCSQPVVAVGPN